MKLASNYLQTFNVMEQSSVLTYWSCTPQLGSLQAGSYQLFETETRKRVAKQANTFSSTVRVC